MFARRRRTERSTVHAFEDISTMHWKTIREPCPCVCVKFVPIAAELFERLTNEKFSFLIKNRYRRWRSFMIQRQNCSRQENGHTTILYWLWFRIEICSNVCAETMGTSTSFEVRRFSTDKKMRTIPSNSARVVHRTPCSTRDFRLFSKLKLGRAVPADGWLSE